MGDPQPEEPPDIEPEIFRRILAEVKVLNPDGVMIVGDVIRGFTNDSLMLTREWNGFFDALGSIQPPVLLSAGNHDIYDLRSQIEFERRTGSLYQSMDIGRVHIITLNSVIVGEENRIAGDQLAWLKKDLEEHKGNQFVFVGVHIPLWAYGTSSNWMSEVHPLLKEYGVRAVFAGHWHIYQHAATIDGINYFVTGGAGGMTASKDIPTGDFHHYMIVRASETGVSYAVVMPGSINGDEFVTRESSQIAGRTVDECFTVPHLEFMNNIAVTNEVHISLNNPFRDTLFLSGRWGVVSPMLMIDPPTTKSHIAPGASAHWKFRLSSKHLTLEQLNAAMPILETEVETKSLASPIVFKNELVGMRSVMLKRTPKDVSVDGDVKEWKGGYPIKINSRLQVTLVPDRWRGPDEASGEFIVTASDSELVLAGIVRDKELFHSSRKEEPYQADAVTLYLDLRDSTEFQKRFFSKDVFTIVFAPELEKGEKPYVTCVSPYGAPVKNIRYASLRIKGGYTIEAAIPLSQLKNFPSSRKTQSVGFDIVIDNLHGNGERVRMAWNGQWGNFMNASRYGLLKLQRKK